MSTNDTAVTDDVESSRFLSAESGGGAYLAYRVDGERLVLTHAEVPESLRGHGIAGRLVRAALQRAEVSGETVVPRCPYTRSWLRSHPSEAERIAVDWADRPGSAEPAGHDD